MAASAKNFCRIFSITFVASFLVFSCFIFVIVHADHSQLLREDESEIAHQDQVLERQGRDTLISKTTVTSDELRTEESTENVKEHMSVDDAEVEESTSAMNVENRTNSVKGTTQPAVESKSSPPLDYYQLLATYMKPEVFQQFIKGLNRTLDAHTQYVHPDFSYADAPESQQRKVKYPCLQRPPGNRTAHVRIVNNTELLEAVSVTYQPANGDNSSSVLGGYCAFVMFFAPWCKFSASAAPAFNAIGRAFPDLEVLAIDAFQFNSLNTRYGIVAVPNILLFHNNKPVMRFNYSDRTFDVVRDFLKNFTGLEPNSSVQVTDLDIQGPLSSVATVEPDYALWLSWLVLAGVAAWVLQQRLGSALVDWMRTFAAYARQVWRTGEFYDQVGVLVHEHQE